jgi:ribosomal-protein-serine acetyltransferase
MIINLKIDSRLELRSARPEHAQAFADLVVTNYDSLRQYLPAVTQVDSLEAAREHMLHCMKEAEALELLEVHIFFENRLCGAIRLNYFEHHNKKVALGYLIDTAYQGKGLVGRSARAMIDFAFNELNLNRIELRCVPENQASVRVAERLGFIREGHLRQAEMLDHGLVDHFVYSLLRSDPRPQPKP